MHEQGVIFNCEGKQLIGIEHRGDCGDQPNENRQSYERNHDLDLTRHHDQKKWLDESLDWFGLLASYLDQKSLYAKYLQ